MAYRYIYIYIYLCKQYAVDTYNRYVYLCERLRFLSGNKDDHNRKAFLDTQSKDELVSLCMNQLKQMDKLRMSLDTSIKTRR